MADAASEWWSTDTVAVVTGGNKGIGLEIVRGLAKKGVTTVLTARDEDRGNRAVEWLKAQGLNSVVFHSLDVTSTESAQALTAWLKKEYGGSGLDILINNAGVAWKEQSYALAKATMAVNYYGVQIVTKSLLPLLRTGARILNISSRSAQLQFIGSSSLAAKLGDVEHLTEDYVDSYASSYLEDLKLGRLKREEWSVHKQYAQYSDSKILLNAYTRAFAKALSSRPDSERIYVNLVYPGYIVTDLTDNTGTGTTEEGADTPVWLALLPAKDYPNGSFLGNREPLAW